MVVWLGGGGLLREFSVITTLWYYRVKLAVHKDTRECIAVKIVSVGEEGLTHDSLKKEVSYQINGWGGGGAEHSTLKVTLCPLLQGSNSTA